MIFYSRKDFKFNLIIYASITILIVGIFLGIQINDWGFANMILIIALGALISLLLWIYYGTQYELSKEYLKYHSGPINGKIPLASIKTIVKNKTLWAGLKPATASNGLIIKYNTFDELYISPDDNDKFITEILALNNTIEIIET